MDLLRPAPDGEKFRLQVVGGQYVPLVHHHGGHIPTVKHDDTLQVALADFVQVERLVERLPGQHEDGAATEQARPTQRLIDRCGDPETVLFDADIVGIGALNVAPFAGHVIGGNFNDLSGKPIRLESCVQLLPTVQRRVTELVIRPLRFFGA